VFCLRDGVIARPGTVDLFMFMFFFPTISAGPIDRYRRFAPDWRKTRSRAEFLADLDGAVHHFFRGLLYKFGAAVDEGIEGSELTKLSAMTKLYCTDVAMEVTTDAVQVLGGYGYISEYPLERMMRDAKITQIYEGTNQIQRLVIAREMLKEQRAFLLAGVG